MDVVGEEAQRTGRRKWRREEGGKGDRRVQALVFGLNLRLDLN